MSVGPLLGTEYGVVLEELHLIGTLDSQTAPLMPAGTGLRSRR